MKMFNSISTVIIGAVLALASTAGSAAVVNSKHDLSAGSGNNAFTSTGTVTGSDQVCVFCHTPHAASATQIIPLWNRDTSIQTFTLYADTGAGTLDGKFADDGGAGGGIGGVSLACLSCHDGSIALASVLNAPGTGNTSFDAGTWLNAGSTLTTLSADAKLSGTGVAGLGTDLSNDHPVAIQYAGGGYSISGGLLNGSGTDTAFVTPTLSTSGTQAWVGTPGTGIPLFTNHLAATPGTNEPFVECASCHNPHGTTNDMFLRVAATDSAICTACHVK
jgi:predicted CXXCH cytochrome family protein